MNRKTLLYLAGALAVFYVGRKLWQTFNTDAQLFSTAASAAAPKSDTPSEVRVDSIGNTVSVSI